MTVYNDILNRIEKADRPVILGPEAQNRGEFLASVENAAAVLKRHGVGPASAVGIALPHSAALIIALFAVRVLRGVTVLSNHRAKAAHSKLIFERAGMRFLIADERQAPMIAELGGKRLDNVGTACLYELPYKECEQLQASDALVIFTSGSTGEPKGVVIDETAISSNIRAVAKSLDLNQEDRALLLTPPSHAYAFSQILSNIWVGGTVLPWPQGTIDVVSLLNVISDNRLTGIAANPSIYKIFFKIPKDQWPEMNSVRYLVTGGQPFFTELGSKLYDYFQNAKILNMYGMTENSPRIASRWLPRPLVDRDEAWSVGLPLDGVNIRVVHKDGTPAPVGEIGEIQVSGESLFRCYLGEEERPDKMSDDGWFSSGDQGFLDEAGELHITGRMDNIFSVGHEKVSPEEIEEVIRRIDDQLEIGVVGVPHDLLGFVPAVLYEEKAKPSDASMDDLRRLCRERLSNSKFPRYFFAVDALPKTSNGKLDRAGLKKLAFTVWKKTMTVQEHHLPPK